jgi:hypothetical protein
MPDHYRTIDSRAESQKKLDRFEDLARTLAEKRLIILP